MIEINRHTLSNGLRIVHSEDNTTQMVALNILYDVGARDEDPEHTGFAHLFEHLMFGGSINVPDYDTPVQNAGGENNAWTNNDITNYYITLPRQNVETGFWLESDRMLSLDFNPRSLEVQRQVVIKEGFVHSKINRADFIYLNKLGWPIALQMGMETASFSLSAIMVGWIGTTALAAHQIMLAISQVCFMMYYGMGAAVAVRVSNFNGQNDRVNVRRTAYSGFHIMLGIALIGALPIFLLRHQLGGWFSDSQAVSVTVAQLIIPFIVYQFGDGLQINFANALRGIADVKPMMYIAFIAYFLISLPAGYFFGFVMDWGIVGIWMAFPFGLTTAGIMYYLRFRSRTLEKH